MVDYASLGVAEQRMYIQKLGRGSDAYNDDDDNRARWLVDTYDNGSHEDRDLLETLFRKYLEFEDLLNGLRTKRRVDSPAEEPQTSLLPLTQDDTGGGMYLVLSEYPQ